MAARHRKTPTKASAPSRNGAPATSKANDRTIELQRRRTTVMNLGKLGVWYFTERMSATQAAETAQRIEALGYSALWIPETTGRNPFAHAAWLLAKTQKLDSRHRHRVDLSPRTRRDDGGSKNARGTIRTTVSCSASAFRTSRWSKACAASNTANPSQRCATIWRRWMRHRTAQSRRRSRRRASSPRSDRKCSNSRAIRAPARIRTSRSPDHTAMARKVLGPKPWLCVEQKVILETDAAKARPLARANAAIYLDVCRTTATTGCGWVSPKTTSATAVPTASSTRRSPGATAEAIKKRIKAHFDAGASHVCIQPINPNGAFGDLHWQALEELQGAALMATPISPAKSSSSPAPPARSAARSPANSRTAARRLRWWTSSTPPDRTCRWSAISRMPATAQKIVREIVR